MDDQRNQLPPAYSQSACGAALDPLSETGKNGHAGTLPYDCTLAAKQALQHIEAQIWASWCAVNQITAPVRLSIGGYRMPFTDQDLRPLVRTCVGRLDDYAVQQEDGSYRRMFAPLTYDCLREHLAGLLTIGPYLITERNVCRFAVLDADGSDGLLQLLAVQQTLAGLAVPSYLEGSRRGVHLRVVVAGAISPALLRQALLPFCPPGVEFYPKQDTATSEHPGSLMRLPLGVHRRSGRRYPFLTFSQDHFDLAAPSISATLAWLGTIERVPVSVLAQLALAAQAQASNKQTYPAKTSTSSVPFPPGEKPTIRGWCAAQDPYALIGRYVTLDSRGMGCCPFGSHHDDGKDTHPSFKVHTPKMPGGYCWYCHTWKRGGSVFDFLQLYYNLETRELWHRILSGGQF